jgi:hypothetical protein
MRNFSQRLRCRSNKNNVLSGVAPGAGRGVKSSPESPSMAMDAPASRSLTQEGKELVRLSPDAAVFFVQQSGSTPVTPLSFVIHGFSHFLRTSLTTADFADAKSAKGGCGLCL